MSRQAFNDWRLKGSGGPTDAEVAEAELVAAMRQIHAESDATYGQLRMMPELVEFAFKVKPQAG